MTKQLIDAIDAGAPRKFVNTVYILRMIDGSYRQSPHPVEGTDIVECMRFQVLYERTGFRQLSE